MDLQKTTRIRNRWLSPATIFAAVLLASALALLASCDSTPKAGGTLRLTMDLPRGFSAAGAKDFSIDPGKGNTVVATWEYKAIPSSASLAGAVTDWKELAKGGTGATVVGMGQGLWEIHVRGLNAQGTRLLQGSASGYLTAASSAMRIAVGIPTDEAAVGTLDLRATWDAAAVHDGILAVTYRSQDPVNGTYGQWTQAPAATQATKLAAGDDGATTAWDVHSGSHMVKVLLMDNGVALAGRVSAARVIDGAKSTQDIRMVVGQFIDMDLTVDDMSGAAVFGTLELGAQSYVQNDEVTVTWKPSEGSPEPTTWEWYLDGVHLVDTDKGTYTFIPPKAGDLTISCTAYNDRAGSPGSAQVQVLVANAQPTVSRTLKVEPGQTTQFAAPPVMAPEGAPEGAPYVVVGYTLAGAKDVAQVDFPYTNNTQAVQELEPVYVPLAEFAQTDAQGKLVGIEVPYVEDGDIDLDTVYEIPSPLLEAYKAVKYVALPMLEEIPPGLFLHTSSLESVVMAGGTAICDFAFTGCSSLASITIPDSVTIIGEWAFSFCTSLASITIPEVVTTIGEYAFRSCTSLASITIPEGVTTICDGTFAYCESLTDATIPSSVIDIQYYVFQNCTSLVAITIPDSVTDIGAYAFAGCTSLASVKIPDGVTTIGERMFRGCTSLTSVKIPDGVTTIRDMAFYECTNLATVKIPSSVTAIGYGAFRGCRSLTSITIPGIVTFIDKWAFYDCRSLTSVEIPDGVTSIGQNTFGGCSSLTSIVIPNSVTSISDCAFMNCTSLASVAIPRSVISIGTMAFSGCLSLTPITIPNSVRTIGAWAFQNCTSLVAITIPDSVTIIGDEALSGCSSLRSIVIPTNVMSIGDRAFQNCTNLSVYINKPTNYITGSPWELPGGVAKVFWNSTGPQ